MKKNEGEVPQYYVEHSHPEIISREIFDMVKQEFEKRKGIKSRSGSNMFSSKIVCGDCGGFYGSKVWHSNDKYRRVIWRCNHKYKNEKRCQTPIIREVQIKEKFVDVINRLIQDKTSVIADCEKIIAELRDTSTIENKELKLKAEQNVLYNSMKELVNQMAHSKNVNAEIEGKNIEINQNRELPAQALRQYENLKNQYEKNNEKLIKLENTRLEWRVKKQRTLELLDKIKNQNNLITDFDEQMWYTLVEKVIVNRDGNLNFELKNGVKF